MNYLQAAADESAVKELKLPAAPAVSAYLIEKWMQIVESQGTDKFCNVGSRS